MQGDIALAINIFENLEGNISPAKKKTIYTNLNKELENSENKNIREILKKLEVEDDTSEQISNIQISY